MAKVGGEDQPALCDTMTLLFLIIRNIHAIYKKNIAKIAKKGYWVKIINRGSFTEHMNDLALLADVYGPIWRSRTAR